jgi:hypothetical protein
MNFARFICAVLLLVAGIFIPKIQDVYPEVYSTGSVLMLVSSMASTLGFILGTKMLFLGGRRVGATIFLFIGTIGFVYFINSKASPGDALILFGVLVLIALLFYGIMHEPRVKTRRLRDSAFDQDLEANLHMVRHMDDY